MATKPADISAKYPQPRVLLIDMDMVDAEALRQAGYNITPGTFGSACDVQPKDAYLPVILSPQNLPHNIAEFRLIIADFRMPRPHNGVLPPNVPSAGLKRYWAHIGTGLLNPRPLAMELYRPQFDRVLDAGGVFIIFADYRDCIEYQFGTEYELRSEAPSKLITDDWAFLSVLNPSVLTVTRDFGEQITVVDKNDSIGSVLSRYLEGATFSCTISCDGDKLSKIAVDGHGGAVAGALQMTSGARLFFFPHVANRPEFLLQLINGPIQELSPLLFPHAAGKKWAHGPDYEQPDVLDLRQQIANINFDRDRSIQAIEAQIEEKILTNEFLYDLITGTGDALAKAVKTSLSRLGFQKVIDVDEVMRATQPSADLREDFLIEDRKPILVIDVKGVAGGPSDDEALQSAKHALIRMQEWKHTDVKALTIINHQRNIAALDRNNDSPFRPQLLAAAKQQQVGLLTAWDFFRLIRGKLKNGWSFEQVEGVLYRIGRIEPIPEHYEFIGIVEKVAPNLRVAGIRIGDMTLNLGDRIAFELPVDFVEQDVASLEIENVSVKQAGPGTLPGIQTGLTKKELREGLRVFRARR